LTSAFELCQECVNIIFLRLIDLPEIAVDILFLEWLYFFDFNFLDFDTSVGGSVRESACGLVAVILVKVLVFFLSIIILVFFVIVCGRILTEDSVEVGESLHDFFHLNVVVVLVVLLIIVFDVSGGAATKSFVVVLVRSLELVVDEGSPVLTN